ncbi:MAG: YbaK/EbsC family protein [Thaumarchaeota archaeon]|nr:YbaK/EbsC family protein [Nitrososphaerota archaeon]
MVGQVDRAPAILNSKYLSHRLEAIGIKFWLIKHGPAYSATAASEELQVPLDRIVKTILFIDGSAKPLLVVCRGDKRVNQTALARRLGMDGLRLATAEEVVKITGYEVGSLPPVALLSSIRTVVDQELPPDVMIYAGGGEIDMTLKIRLSDIVEVQKAEMVRLHD